MNTPTKSESGQAAGTQAITVEATGVDKTGERVQAMFAQIAPRYDMMNHVLSLGIDIRWRHRVVKEMRLRDSSSKAPVLDCCTGTGDLAIMIAKASGGRFAVNATDFCAPMLEHAERKRKAAGLEGVEFQEADSMALPFEDDYFQAVTCAFGLRNIQDTEQGLREMARVCKPGGQVGILEFSHPTAPVLKQSYQAYFRYVLPRIGQAVASNDQSAYEYLPNSVREFPSGQALADVMQQCGYSNVKLFPMTLGVATLYLGEVN